MLRDKRNCINLSAIKLNHNLTAEKKSLSISADIRLICVSHQLIKVLRQKGLENRGKKRKDLHANWSTRLSRADSMVSTSTFFILARFAIYVARGTRPPPAIVDQISFAHRHLIVVRRDTRGNVGSVVIYAPKQAARVGHKFIFIGRSARTWHRGLACKYLVYEDNRFAFNNGEGRKTLDVADHFAKC